MDEEAVKNIWGETHSNYEEIEKETYTLNDNDYQDVSCIILIYSNQFFQHFLFSCCRRM